MSGESDGRMLRLRVMALKEDNPWLPDDVAVRRGVSMCSPISHRPESLISVDEMVDLEMRSAGVVILALLRREGLIEKRS